MSEHPAATRSNCVLVVDDDTAVRNLIRISLEREKLEVVTALDGLEAIQHLEDERCSVLILDLMMPRVSGWEVIEWLKLHPERAPRTVVVVTAADRVVFSQLDPEVVNAIIVKPFDVYELAGYVSRCCEAPVDRDRRQKRLIGGN
ncbi:MAG: response regulator [Thermoanaerobaculia bacterium]